MLKRYSLITILLQLVSISVKADVSGFIFDSNANFTFGNYFVSLFITIFLEVMVGILLFNRWKLSNKNLKFIIYCNLITHPIFWLIGELIGWSLGFALIGELLIIVIESILLIKFFKINIPGEFLILLSFIMNLFSAVIGGWIYFALTI